MDQRKSSVKEFVFFRPLPFSNTVFPFIFKVWGQEPGLRSFPVLVFLLPRRILWIVNSKWSKWLPYIFMLMAALSRWPGLFPPNFSAFYALAFCAGAFFPRQIKWWLPPGALVFSDRALNLYYYFALGINSFRATQLINYACFLG